MNLREALASRAERSRKQFKEKYYKNTFIYVKDPPPEEIDIEKAIQTALDKVPEYMVRYVDSVYVGAFKDLKDRDINAKYKDGAIYVTNDQSSADDVIDDIVHEIAHALEGPLVEQIYSDGELEKEFLNKRRQLSMLLSSEGYSFDEHSFLDPEYDWNIDQFLFREVGYPTLAALTVNMFHSPYAITSLREYFANGFEAFFHENVPSRIRSISPKLYDKLIMLQKIGEEENGI